MIATLLKKDLQRMRRNPWPVLINLALPITITAIIGLAFGKSNSNQGIGKISIAIVDEDDNALGQFLQGAFQQGDSQSFFQPEFLDRSDAQEKINDNAISAVLIIPDDFTDAFLENRTIPALELIKNPAQRFHPAIVEEFLEVLLEGMNAVSRNLRDEIPDIIDIAKTDEFPDMLALAGIMIKIGNKFKVAEDYLTPPLIAFSEASMANEKEDQGPGFNLFAFLLPMLSSVFLLFLADGTIRDIYREIKAKTLTRMRTVHYPILPVVLSKSSLAVVMGLLGGCVLFVGGGLVFQIDWKTPFRLALLIAAYSICAAGFMAFLVSLFKTEKRADALSSIVIMSIAFLGGGFIQVDALPDFIQNHLSPWMPNYWFIQSVQQLQFARGDAVWYHEATKMLIIGTILLGLGTLGIRRALEKGAMK